MSRGQVLLVFDDGLATHLAAAQALDDRGLAGTFAVVTSKIGQDGFMTQDELIDLATDQHLICNHSHEHRWSGAGEFKPGLAPFDVEQITQDLLTAKETLDAYNNPGIRGDILCVPFGTTNLDGPEHIKHLLMLGFRWIRLTIGTPLSANQGMWSVAGGKRLFPRNYDKTVIGISAAADVRRPGEVQEKIHTAIETGTLAVLLYHDVCHVVGNTQNLTWGRFMGDMDFIARRIKEGGLECVTPLDLIKPLDEEQS